MSLIAGANHVVRLDEHGAVADGGSDLSLKRLQRFKD
jgi:hypothetical protein